MAFVSSLHPSLRAYYILNCDAIFAGPAPRNPDPECDPEYRESPWSEEEQPSGFEPFRALKGPESTAPQRMEKSVTAHNPEVVGSSPAPATTKTPLSGRKAVFFSALLQLWGTSPFPGHRGDPNRDPYGQKTCPEAVFSPPGSRSFGRDFLMFTAPPSGPCPWSWPPPSGLMS